MRKPMNISGWKLMALAAPAIFAIVAVAALASFPIQSSDTIADFVLGQVDFNHATANTIDGANLDYGANLSGVAVDASHTPNRLYVSDFGNSRVLGYSSIAALMTGEAATIVIGQPDVETSGGNSTGISASSLNEPQGVAVDSSGNLYVADAANSRVLEYSNPFTINGSTGQTAGFTAATVFGQAGDFFVTACDNDGSIPDANSLCDPTGVALDSSNKLYVADRQNNRVLEFNTPLTSQTANIVFGQAGSFTTDTANNGGVSATSLNEPDGVAIDKNNRLYVADTNNARVLEYNTPLTSQTANLVFGQGGSFTLNSCNNGGVTANSLCTPTDVALDSSANVYIPDFSNNRLLEYNEAANPPTNTTANKVFGQLGAFTLNTCNLSGLSDVSLCFPAAAALDSSGDLYIEDSDNNRVLQYVPPFAASPVASVALGQIDFTHNAANSVDGASMDGPEHVAIDTHSTPHHLYVADFFNNRVLGYNNAASLANDQPADIVIGQADLEGNSCNNGGLSKLTLCEPVGVAVDSSDNLYVGDFANNRVLEFTNPFANGHPVGGFSANLVFGQGGSFTTDSCNQGGIGAGTLCEPQGVALDGNNRLYVADFDNHRVLEYNTPLTSQTANLVFGQGGSFVANSCNNGGVSANSLCAPVGVGLDSSNNLYVGDFDNNRVLEYNEAASPPTNTTANTVFGQAGSFTTNSCDNGGVTANSLCEPEQVALDSSNNLWVADFAADRVLEYNTPLTTDTTADHVLGQADDFTTSACDFGSSHPDQDSECRPEGTAVDTNGNVFVSDDGNNRVLEYLNPLAPPPTPTPTPTPGPLTLTGTLKFGNVAKNNTSKTKTITITNPGPLTATITSVGVSGPNAGDFAISSNTCIGMLLATKKCTFKVAFTPTAAVGTAESATVSVNDNASNSPQTVAATGTSATQVGITPTTNPISFGTIVHGTMKSITVDFTNNQDTAMTALSASITAGSPPYSIPTNTCTATLAAFTECKITVQFAPTTVGNNQTGTLTITDSPDSLSPHVIGLTGNAT